MKGIIPDAAGFAAGFEAEFKRHPPENEAQQHNDHRDIQSRHNDGVSQRKCGKQPAATQNQPGFIAVPEGGDGIHHTIPGLVRGSKRKKNAHSQVKAVQQNIEEYRSGDQTIPDQWEIHEAFKVKHVILPLSRAILLQSAVFRCRDHRRPPLPLGPLRGLCRSGGGCSSCRRRIRKHKR